LVRNTAISARIASFVDHLIEVLRGASFTPIRMATSVRRSGESMIPSLLARSRNREAGLPRGGRDGTAVNDTHKGAQFIQGGFHF
jgi:hypothetical protein